MKTLHKWIIFLLALSTAALTLLIIIWMPGKGGRDKEEHAHFNADTTRIPSSYFAKSLVRLDIAIKEQQRFDEISKIKLESVLYHGVILRNADVLLSLGLNNLELLKSVEATDLRLKTALAVTDSMRLHVYVHPVATGKPGGRDNQDLYFDKDGNIYDEHGNPWKNQCDGLCKILTGSKPESRANQQQLKAILPSGLYVIDLNNPCPPCSP